MSKENKSIPVGYRLTKTLVDKITEFQELKSKELGLKLTKNQAVEMLLNDGLKVNGIE